jgi:hypothetical protein
MKTASYLPYVIAGAVGAIMASLVPLLVSPSKADTKLLPFQGRLTDSGGAAIVDGAKVVEFKIYDTPTGGNVKWAGEVHKLSVNGGLVSTMLGSKASLGGVDFSASCFLQITIDANDDGQITAADPPLLPRQFVVPATYAAVAGQLQYVVPAAGGNPASVAGAGWGAVFDNGRPDTGKISGGKLASGSIGSDQLGAGSVTSAKIADGTILSGDIAPDAITSGQIASGSVGSAELASNSITNDNILDGTIQTSDVANGAITPAKMSVESATFYQQASPTAASPGWQSRDINNGPDSPGGSISRTGSVITLQPGTYHVEAEAFGNLVDSHQLILRDITNGISGVPTMATAVLIGLNCQATQDHVITLLSPLRGQVVVAGPARQFELWQWCLGSHGIGLGVSHSTTSPPSGANTLPNRSAQISVFRIK